MLNAFLRAIDKHVVCESTNLGGTNYAKHIYNVVASDDIDNGKLVNLTDMKYYKNATAGGLITSGTTKGTVIGNDKHSNGECFTMVEPTSTSKVGLIISVPTEYDTTPYQATLETNYYNGKGEVMRVYELMEGDRFTISENGIDAAAVTTLAVGQYVKADGYDIAAVSGTTAPTAAFVGEIIEKITRTNGVFYKIVVRKNA